MSKEFALFSVNRLQISLGRGQQIELSFSLSRGGVVQLRGPSGCGKTTVLRALARLDALLHGEMKLEGKLWKDLAAPDWRRRVTYLAQLPVMFEGTVRQNLAAGLLASQGGDRWEPKAQRMLRELCLDPDSILDQDARTLSGGEAARVALCRTLLIEPSVLLADEPTASLDSDASAALVEMLRRWLDEGGAMILVAHDEAHWQAIEKSTMDLTRKVSER